MEVLSEFNVGSHSKRLFKGDNMSALLNSKHYLKHIGAVGTHRVIFM